MYDIAIIGLGPAGCFLARYLNKKFRVIAIDRKQAAGEGGFHKPCGGLLAPDAQKSLSRFHMTLPKDILVSPQIFSVRTIDMQSGMVRHYQRHYINLDRHKFDQWLLSQLPGHVEVHSDATCTGVAQRGESYAVTYVESGSTRTINAKYVVGADGAASIVRRSLYPEFHIPQYMSIQQWFSDAHDTPFYSCVFDPDVTDSYAWGLTKDEYFIFGGAFPVKGAKEGFEALKKKLGPYGFQLDHPLKTEACLALRPFGFNTHCGGHGAFFIGEAAGFISPSSLEGISYAIDSGFMLARCLNSSSPHPNRAYQNAMGKLKMKLFLKTLKRPFLYHPLARRIVMRSGLRAISLWE